MPPRRRAGLRFATKTIKTPLTDELIKRPANACFRKYLLQEVRDIQVVRAAAGKVRLHYRGKVDVEA
jgi:hypothetical protein